MQTFTDADFSTAVLQSQKPVLVDFWASWCGPCRLQTPIVEEVAAEAGDRFVVGGVEVDASPHVSQQHNIMSIPTLMIFVGGKPVWRVSGVTQKATILEELAKAAQ